MVLFIGLLVLFIIVFIIILIICEWKGNNQKILRNSTILFDFNTKDKTFQIKHWKHIKVIIPHWMAKNFSILSRNPQPISEWRNIFADEDLIKEIRRSFYIMDSKNKMSFSFSFDSNLIKPASKLFFEFNKTSNIKGSGKIIWKENEENSVLVHDNYNSLIKTIDKDSFYKIYLISFLLPTNISSVKGSAMEIRDSIKGEIFFFEQRGYLYFVLSSKLKDDLYTKHNLIRRLFLSNNLFYKRRKILSINFTPVKKEKLTPFKMNSNIRSLDYLSYSKEDVIGKRNLENTELHSQIISDPLYKKYIDSHKMFESLIKNKEVGIKVKKIYNIKNNKVISYLLIPSFNNLMSPSEIKMIDFSRWENEITDVFSEKIILEAKNLKRDKPQILEVNSEWFIKNYKEIEDISYLYLIKINNLENMSELSSILNYSYKTKKIKCGIKIENNSNMDLNLLKDMNIFFVVIDEDITSRWNENIGFSKIFLLIRVFKNRNIKVIYTNPKTKLDEILDVEFNVKYAFFN